MALELLLLIIVVAGGILHLYLRTFVKSTVEKSVGHQFDLKLEGFKQVFEEKWKRVDRKDRFLLASLDKKFKAHQQALALALKIHETLFSQNNEKFEVQKEFRKFWNEKCLYLSKNSRQAIWKTMNLYMNYEIYLTNWRTKSSPDAGKTLEEAFNHIFLTPAIITNDVDIEEIILEPAVQKGMGLTPYGPENKNEVSKLTA